MDNPLTPKVLSVQEVANEFDLSIASVNYYTNLGLIVVAHKKGNKRLYDYADVLRRITKIRDLMRMGYTLRLIQREFFMSTDFNRSEGERHDTENS